MRDDLFTQPSEKKTPVDPSELEESTMQITVKQLRETIRQVVAEEYDPNSVESLYELYSDIYKEKHNIRPRWTRPEDHDAAGWQMMIDDLEAEPAGLD